METQLISNYDLVHDADTIGLNEPEAYRYFASALGPTKEGKPRKLMDRTTYYKNLKRVKEHKQQMLFTLAKTLPEVHVTQIESLRMIRKRLFSVFLSEKSTKLMCDVAKTIVEVERAISEYNGWTQKITEETVKRFDATKEQDPPAIHPPS